MITAKQIQELREKTGISIMECKKALEESKGEEKKALMILMEKGFETAEKKSARETSQGLIETYVHANGKIGVLVELACETDFVSRNDLFKELAHDLAMQITSMNPKDIKELLIQDYIKDPSLNVNSLITQKIQQIGENIKVKRFIRFELGE